VSVPASRSPTSRVGCMAIDAHGLSPGCGIIEFREFQEMSQNGK
jgi:hypothetical protein